MTTQNQSAAGDAVSEPFPRMFRVDQVFETKSLADPAGAARTALAELPASKFIRRGMTVAVGAGSRGISHYDLVVRTVCEELQRLGAQVFIVPAMGSHGGGTDAGQLQVLADYGITPASMGVPVRSSMEVVELGRAGEFMLYQDRHAAGADAIVVVNRIKPHTDFHGPLESGLMKMAVVGLGKQKGAHQFHQATVRLGHAQALLDAGRELLKRSRLAFGVGIIENQLHQTARVAAVPAAAFEPQEMALLEEARALMPRLPFDEVDLLIVDEMGKNLSGSGVDPNVVRRNSGGSFVTPGANPVLRIYIRSLHPDSHGNATGVGLADFVHDRLVNAMDPQATWLNVMTSLMPANARLPMHFPTDRQALATAVQGIGRPDPRQAKLLWIKNTLNCQTAAASEPYLDEARRRSDLKLQSDPAPLAFDTRGDLLPIFS